MTEQRVIIVRERNDTPQAQANLELEKLGQSWKILSAQTTCTIFSWNNNTETWFTTTIVLERKTGRKKKNPFLEMQIADLDISVRSRNCLESANILTVKDLVKWSELELTKIRSLGGTSFREVKRWLQEHELHLGMSV